MIKKGLFFFALIAVLLAALHTTYGTPDIASYAVISSGQPKLFNDLSFGTNKAGTIATWSFKPTEIVPITTDNGFQTQFPKFVDFSNTPTIKLYKGNSNTPVGVTFTVSTSPQASRAELIRCLFFKPNQGFTFDKNVRYRFEIEGCTHRERPDLSGNCGSSMVKLADTGDVFTSIIGDIFGLATNFLTNPLAPVHSCDAKSCCGDARLSLFKGNRLIEDGAPDTCFVGDIDRSAITNAPAETVTLSSVEITTTNHICGKKSDVTFTFYTSTILAAKGPKGVNNQYIPGYCWFYLPLHRGTENDVNAIDDVIQTQLSFELSHTIGGVQKQHKYIGTTDSPALVVRRLSTSSQYGIIVQIALEIDIPASAQITAKIIGLYNPSYPSNSCGSYGRYSSSDSCCSPHRVEYKHGNSVSQPTKALSLCATKCPNYFTTEESFVTTSASKEIWKDVRFTPDCDLNEDDSVDAAFLSLAVTAEASAYNEYTCTLPGFKHKNYDNCAVSTRDVRPGDNAREVPLSDIAVYENNILRTPTHVHVIQSEFDVKFRFFGIRFEANASIQFVFPRLKATSKLPRRNQCNLGVGNANRDFKCCRDFSLTISVTNGNVEAQYIHSQSCPILGGSRPIDCTKPESFTPGQCCSDSQIAYLRGYSTEQYKECQEYRCKNPRSDLFSPDLCCNNERFNNNEKCCSNGWFCPQTCCLNEPGQYFHAPMCCKLLPGASGDLIGDYQFNSEITNRFLPKICKCHKAADASEWETFAQKDCCRILDNVTDQTTTITHTLPRICHCQELFDALAALDPANPSSPTPAEIDVQNTVINKWIVDHPTLTPEYCCKYSTDNSAITNTEYFTKWCTCQAGQLPWDQICCEYDSFAQWCPIRCASTDDCGCNCKCGNGNGGCCDNQRVDINDVTSGDNTIITIASNKKRHSRRANNADNEL